MPETVVILQEELERKSDKSPHIAKDGNGEVWRRWDQDWKPLLGQRVKLTYEVKERTYNGATYRDNIVSEAHPVSEGSGEAADKDYETPTLKARRIFASTAANCATQATDDFIGRQPQHEVSPARYEEVWDKMFAHFFDKLVRAGAAVRDEDIPF